MLDVLVIGAGPAGSHTARRLAELGHRVAVVEEHSEIGQPMCCTGILGKDCLKDFPIPSELIWSQTGSARFYTPSGQSFTLSKEPAQAYIIDRAGLDRALAAQAQKAGVEYFLSSLAQDIAWRDGAVQVQIKNGGRPTVLEAKAVVLACGPSALLPRKLGWKEIGDWAWGAQAEVELKDTSEVDIYMGQRVAPGFFAWLVPTTPGRAWAGLMCRNQAGAHLRAFLDRLYREGKISSPQAQITYGRVPLQPRPRTYGDRLVAVGDAAGQVKPTTGGGIYWGLLGAEMAARVLHQALQDNDLSARFLSRYQRQWKKRLSRELRVGYWARRFYEKLEDEQIEAIVRQLRSSGFLDSLFQSAEFSFDRHSVAILKTLGARPTLSAHLLQAVAESLLPFDRLRAALGDRLSPTPGRGVRRADKADRAAPGERLKKPPVQFGDASQP